MTSGGVEDLLDEHLSSGDPAGAIFEETLEDLSNVDRQLLLFCAGSNLAAVRWLFVLSANKECCDSNGTTALHTACRTGALPIVKELVCEGLPLDATDVAGWTPLHIAIFMCRRDVIILLLQSGAMLHQKNLKGQTPLETCNDTWTREAIRSYMFHMQRAPDQPWHFEKEMDAYQDFSASRTLRYEPFFVPRSQIINDMVLKPEFQKLGQHIFNRRPGQGLAFLVASGCTRDYPVDMSTFLRKGKVDLAQIGNFLGEAFSLSQTLRLEFINSVKFHDTSVISSLAKVFGLLQIPPDLQKIDRLVHGIARIWWRQHEKLSDGTDAPVGQPNAASETLDGEKELLGFELKQYFISPDALYQLMFSVVMLHWNLYAPRRASGTQNGEQRMPMSKWLDINRGLERDGSDVPPHILKSTYRTVCRGFIPQLAIRTPARTADNAQSKGDGAADPGNLLPGTQLAGWARLVGGSFPTPAGLLGGVSHGHISSVFSEATAIGRRDFASASGTRSPRATAQAQPVAGSTPLDLRPAGKDRVWLCLCYTLLLFFSSTSRDEAPYALVHLRRVAQSKVDRSLCTLTLVGASDSADAAVSVNVPLVFLLPDGRWQEFELPKLEIQLPDAGTLDKWAAELQAAVRDPSPAEDQDLFKRPTIQAPRAPPAPELDISLA